MTGPQAAGAVEPLQADSAQIDALSRMLGMRRSVRGFRPDPVPQSILDHVFALATRAPSNCNVQPWVVHVVSGGAAETVRTSLYDIASSGAAPSPDYPLTGAYPGSYRARQIEAAKALFTATGVARDDVGARAASFLRNFRFFDAPHAAFILMPDWAEIREAADCGMYVQTLMLAMTAYGIASCAQGALGHYAAVVRDVLNIPDDLRLLYGISFGYEDPQHPANDVRTSRAALEETTVFHR